jgi:hypothetical protein
MYRDAPTRFGLEMRATCGSQVSRRAAIFQILRSKSVPQLPRVSGRNQHFYPGNPRNCGTIFGGALPPPKQAKRRSCGCTLRREIRFRFAKFRRNEPSQLCIPLNTPLPMTHSVATGGSRPVVDVGCCRKRTLKPTEADVQANLQTRSKSAESGYSVSPGW